MPKFSAVSIASRDTCHNDLIIIADTAILYYDFRIVWGFRNEQQQNEAFEHGYSSLVWPNSKHNTLPSLAMDCVPYPSLWDDRDKLLLMSGIILGVAFDLYNSGRTKHLLRWGGDWNRNWEIKDEKRFDAAHFELIKPT